MKRIKEIFAGNYRLIAFTFQLFWVLIFLLNRFASNDAGGVPQFVYVNF